MNQKIFFLSGLPRSGSTLIANVLAQNPAIYTTPTSACHDGMLTIRNNWYPQPRKLVDPQPEKMHRVLGSLMEGWDKWEENKADKNISDPKNLARIISKMAAEFPTDDLAAVYRAFLFNYHNTDRPIVVNKGRGWLPMLEMVEYATGEKAKVIVPVRDIPQILSSFEKLHRKHAHERPDRGDFFKAQTVQGRCLNLLGDNDIIGIAYNRLKDALQRGLEDRLLLVEFSDLTYNPQGTMERIYDFLEVEPFEHDFENVEQVTEENDFIHGADYHKIRPKIKPVKDDSVKILGKQLVKDYTGTEFWRQ